jgi:4'-phosphopantetheinyl transferase
VPDDVIRFLVEDTRQVVLGPSPDTTSTRRCPVESVTVNAGTLAVRLAWGTTEATDLLAGLLGEPVAVRHACPACGSDRHGRPTAVVQDGRTTAVSIAHAGAMTLVALAGQGRVGVDLEPLDSVAPPGVRGDADPLDLSDLELWVLKEAFLKASGDGLRRDPSTVGLDEPGAVWGRVEIDGYVAAWCVLQPTRGSFGSLRASSQAENSGRRSSRE